MPVDTKRKSGAVPTSRLGRALRFGMLTGELALSAAVGTARQLSTGRPVDLAASLLTPGNAEMLARRLAVLRGPAMKLGQLISLSGEELVPEEFRRALDVLRSQGYSMPDSQLRRVLGREYGKGWQEKFAHFDFEPVAAASIGQIHRARKVGGRELALKIQYPGVARSVDSDVDNLAMLLRRLGFLPLQLDVPALASEAKRQLKLETDYESEARNLERYRKLVAVMPDVVVPRVDRALTTRHVLAMDWIDGEPLEALASEAVPQARRNAVARTLYELMFRELFEFRFVQTDPNFANYLYLPATHQLGLLDLGSAGEYPAALVASYRDICRAMIAGDDAALREAMFAIGYAHPDDPEAMIRNAADILRLACEPLVHRGPYDFAGSGLAVRARDLGLAVAFGKGLRSPPPATIFLHRKLIGTFLICAKLRARVNVHAIIERFI
ncbi:MAG: AarF/ABC1/UbiB kinase family protein [Gammaproteobacteria bacterium]|nr:AarF/ABC1/UbiB kinase family protein [Gammaproteobacteria bacterium]MDH4311544.1 AarF/ABC1/UbiB kinase family protein [Gammaproteobacteria bacterium]MDH5272935.1 AarF/ABC1/UbiB kinase family protein [Gammaproteobacteria bacterium]